MAEERALTRPTTTTSVVQSGVHAQRTTLGEDGGDWIWKMQRTRDAWTQSVDSSVVGNQY